MTKLKIKVYKNKIRIKQGKNKACLINLRDNKIVVKRQLAGLFTTFTFSKYGDKTKLIKERQFYDLEHGMCIKEEILNYNLFSCIKKILQQSFFFFREEILDYQIEIKESEDAPKQLVDYVKTYVKKLKNKEVV